MQPLFVKDCTICFFIICIGQISVSVDGHHNNTGTAFGDFTMLSSEVLYLAGSEDVQGLPGSQINHNFRGCMQQVHSILY